MNNDHRRITYFLYARKSSESEDRQIQSIDDQINRLKKLAADLGLTIKTVLTEAHSAKAPGERPVFNDMLKRIEKGEANGILCWQINRLSRNPIDSARVQWLLQQDVIQSIQTIDGERRPEDNVLLFSVEAGVSNQYIIDLRKNIKRGLQCKVEKGWLPCLAPAGYLNEFRERTIVRDTERFDLVKRMWDLMFTVCYTPAQILEIATNDWGYRTRKTPRGGSKELSLSGLYRIFSNPFYCGIIEYAGKQYLGRHEPMISVENYDRVQIILGKKQKPQPQKHRHEFTGIIRCGECGCLITAERKIKFVKSAGKFRSYTYYRCTRRKKHVVCSQLGRITDVNLREQIEREIKQYQIIPIFRDWALDMLSKEGESEIAELLKIRATQQQTLGGAKRQLENLTRMRYQELIEDEEYIRERDKLKSVIVRLEVELANSKINSDQSSKLTETAFNFAANASEAFAKGDPMARKEIALTLGLNHALKGGKFSVQAAVWLKRIQDDYQVLLKEYLKFEPIKNRLNTGSNSVSNSIIARWSRTVKAVRTAIRKNNDMGIIDLDKGKLRGGITPGQSPQVHPSEEKLGGL